MSAEDAILTAKAEAWDEGFAVGAEAGGRWMENGGSDRDDVNPYSGEVAS